MTHTKVKTECYEAKIKNGYRVKHFVGHSRGGDWNALSDEVILLGSHPQGVK